MLFFDLTEPKHTSPSFGVQSLLECVISQEVLFVLKDESSFVAFLSGLCHDQDQMTLIFRHVRTADHRARPITNPGDRFCIPQEEIERMHPARYSDRN